MNQDTPCTICGERGLATHETREDEQGGDGWHHELCRRRRDAAEWARANPVRIENGVLIIPTASRGPVTP